MVVEIGTRSASAPDLMTRFAESASHAICEWSGAMRVILFVRIVACAALRVIRVSGPVALSLPQPSVNNEVTTSPPDARPKRIILSRAMTLDDIARGRGKGSRLVGKPLQMRRDRRARLLRCDDRDHLEFDDIAPVRHPLIEQHPVVAVHNLKAPLEISGDPAREISGALRTHPSFLVEASINRLWITIAILLDHHEEHLRRTSRGSLTFERCWMLRLI